MSSRQVSQAFLRLNELAIEAKAGSEEAFNTIAKTLHPRIRSVAIKIKPRGGSAIDDMITDGTTAIMNAVNKWDPSKGTLFSTYCMKCAENAMLNSIRNIGRYQRETAIDSIPESFLSDSQPPDEFESIEDLKGLTVSGDIAASTIEQMSPQQKKLILAILSGRSVADAAVSCGITEEVAKRRLKTAIQFIQFDMQRASTPSRQQKD